MNSFEYLPQTGEDIGYSFSSRLVSIQNESESDNLTSVWNQSIADALAGHDVFDSTTVTDKFTPVDLPPADDAVQMLHGLSVGIPLVCSISYLRWLLYRSDLVNDNFFVMLVQASRDLLFVIPDAGNLAQTLLIIQLSFSTELHSHALQNIIIWGW